MLSFVTTPFRLAGTDSAVLRDTKCPSPVSRSGVVVRMRQVGSMDVTLQWRMGLLVAKSVIIGQVTAVYGQITLTYVIVEDSTCTDLSRHLLIATYVTVATDYWVGTTFTCAICSQIRSYFLGFALKKKSIVFMES